MPPRISNHAAGLLRDALRDQTTKVQLLGKDGTLLAEWTNSPDIDRVFEILEFN